MRSYITIVEAMTQPRYRVGQMVRSRPSYSAFHGGQQSVAGQIVDLGEKHGELFYVVKVESETVNGKPYSPKAGFANSIGREEAFAEHDLEAI